jgi:hypothetical protein
MARIAKITPRPSRAGRNAVRPETIFLVIFIGVTLEVLLLESKHGLESVVLYVRNTRYRISQAFSHLHRRFAFADKRIGSGRKGSLVTRI